MRYLLALAPLLCFAADTDSLPPASITILLSGGSPAPNVLPALKTAVESAFAHSRITLRWLEKEHVPAEGVNGELLIIRLRGSCSTDDPAAAEVLRRVEGPVTLGLTHVADGKMLPIADVLCDPIRTLIQRDLLTSPSADREELLGRALGRVAAHEIYHILLHTAAHDRAGLSRASQSSADLLADEASFNAVEQQRLAAAGADGATSASGRH